MHKCYHCGENARNSTLCFNCSNFFCDLHKDPAIHECKLNLEYQNVRKSVEEKDSTSRNQIIDETNRMDGKYQDYHWYQPLIKGDKPKKPERMMASCIILAVVLFFSGISFTFSPLFLFNIYWLLNLNQWTFFTALFVVRLDGVLDLILLILNLIFIFNIMINLETRYSPLFLLKLFCFSSFFSGCFFILARLILSMVIPIGYIDLLFFSTGFGWAGLLGIVSFRFFLEPETQWDVLFCYLPVKMEGKSVLVILILLRLIPNLVIIFTNELYMMIYLSEFFGLIAGGLVYYLKISKSKKK